MMIFTPHASLLLAQVENPGPMHLITWLVLGLVAGFIASKLVNKTGEGFVLDIVLGVVGALVGGWAFHRFGMSGVTGFNIWSVVVAVIGAVVVLLIWHTLRGNLSRRSV